MAGNGFDNAQGADPRRGRSAPTGRAQAYGGTPTGEPEYPTTAKPYGGHPPGRGTADDRPGRTLAFPAGQDPYRQDGPASEARPYQGPDARALGEDHVALYRAGSQATPHIVGPPLGWKALLAGIVREPSVTFDRMREHQVWLPALGISLVYGMLALLALDSAHTQVFDSTFGVALASLAGAAVAFTLAGVILGAVTFGLARQLGGDGPWQSTVGLAALIGWLTDAPRLVLALFLPVDNPLVQAAGWASWLLCAALLTLMVRRVHDLPWGKAAGAGALQLLALLALIKLPTLG